MATLWTPPPLPVAPPARARGEVLDLSLLADLPTLELRARCLMDGFLNGHHRSPRKGFSIEFAEYRNYQLGDDLRRVDWRLYGRTERLHVKQYEEETQLRVFLVLDRSASMNYRSRPELQSKLQFAKMILASLSLLAHRQQDAFGLASMGEASLDFLPARSSLPHWRNCLGKLEDFQPGGTASLAETLTTLADLLPRRSMVIIAGDFYEDPEALEGALRRLHYDRHELIGLHILDPFEIDLADDLQGTFTDLETGQRLDLDAEAVRAGYLERFSKFRGEVENLFHGMGGDYAMFRTDEAPVSSLGYYMARRLQLA